MGGLEVGEVVDRLDRVGKRSTVTPKELAADQGDVPVHACDAHTVVCLCADRARHVRTVVVEAPAGAAVVDGAVAVGEVPAVDVVDVAVPVVVHAVGGIEGVGPDLPGELRVRELDAFVDDAYVDALRAGVAGRPGLGGLSAERVGGSGGVAVHAPEVLGHIGAGEDGVGRRGLVAQEEVELGVRDGGVALQLGDRLAAVCAGRKVDDLDLDAVDGRGDKALRETSRSSPTRPLALSRGGSCDVPDDELVGYCSSSAACLRCGGSRSGRRERHPGEAGQAECGDAQH